MGNTGYLAGFMTKQSAYDAHYPEPPRKKNNKMKYKQNQAT